MFWGEGVWDVRERNIGVIQYQICQKKAVFTQNGEDVTYYLRWLVRGTWAGCERGSNEVRECTTHQPLKLVEFDLIHLITFCLLLLWCSSEAKTPYLAWVRLVKINNYFQYIFGNRKITIKMYLLKIPNFFYYPCILLYAIYDRFFIPLFPNVIYIIKLNCLFL